MAKFTVKFDKRDVDSDTDLQLTYYPHPKHFSNYLEALEWAENSFPIGFNIQIYDGRKKLRAEGPLRTRYFKEY